MPPVRTQSGVVAGEPSPVWLQEIRRLLGQEAVRTTRLERMAYAYDATGEKHSPEAVLIPANAHQVAEVMRVAHRHRVPVVARGAGTNLSGGTVPAAGGIVLSLVRMHRILSVDTERRVAVVEPGVVNLALNEQLRPLGYQFAPDPSSMKVSTVGGNIAENAGGPHCLKYGVTSGHLVALQVATAEGDLVELDAESAYDLRGLMVGSEGTLGVVTRATVRIIPLPAADRTMLALFGTLEEACRSVSGIIAARIIPAALELMDRQSLDLTRESGFHAFPAGAEAALIIEVDGEAEDLDAEAAQILAVCRELGAVEVRAAADEAERSAIWAGRRSTYGVLARASPFIWTQDVTVPRHRLAEMMREVLEIGRRHGLRILTVAHAGDGNLHPTIPFNPQDAGERERVRQADLEILAACVRMGGSISGEHGIGLDKLEGMPLMFPPEQLDLMRRVRAVFDPQGLLNPGKVLPAPKGGC